MNFLAHSFLSGDSAEVLVGNFIADSVKGKKYLQFPEGIQKGILLHREIDYFTDQHEIVHQSKDKLRADYRHYAGVIVDIFYDHFLAAGWQMYSEEKLLAFTQNVYQTVARYESILPEKIRWILPHMQADNWLLNYRSINGVQRTLTGMSKRTKYRSHMEKAATDLEQSYEKFHREFHQFFPLLIAFVAEKRVQL